jgi:tetratricopeptide (TPR) repeat protein
MYANKSLEIWDKTAGKEYNIHRGKSWYILGRIEEKKGNSAKAIFYYQKAKALMEEKYTIKHPDLNVIIVRLNKLQNNP